MQTSRNPKDGVTLASIVARETTDGKWSGIGGGIGLGTGGVGLFVGGMSGTKREQTQRAKTFEAPAKSGFNWLYVYGPIIGMVAVGVMIRMSTGFVEVIHESSIPTQPQGNILAGAEDAMMTVMSSLGTIVPILAALGVCVYYVTGRQRREAEETKRYEEEKKKDILKSDIYYRLRYIENDHVVFDPVTGDEVVAERDAIIELIDRLAK